MWSDLLNKLRNITNKIVKEIKIWFMKLLRDIACYVNKENKKLRKENKKLRKDITDANINIDKLYDEIEELEGNAEFLRNEVTILKQINRKKQINYDEKERKFLIKREKKLQTIEQMVKNDESYNKVKSKIKEA